MSFCTVFANLNNDKLSIDKRLAIHGLVRYLIYKENARNFFAVEDREFESAVIDAISAESNKLFRIYVEPIFPENSPYELISGRVKFKLSNALGTFIICDSTTKDIIINSIDVEYIVKKPDIDIFVIAKSNIGFRF